MKQLGQTTLKALAVLVTVLGFVTMVAWYGFLEPSWLSYRGATFEPVREEVKQGEVIALNVSRCNSSGEKEIYLIAATLIRLDQPATSPTPPAVLPGSPVLIQPGCLDEVSKANSVPDDQEPGVYFLDGISKTDARWRSVNVHWNSRPFRVVAR